MLAATQKKFDLSQVSDGKVIETLQLFDGQFTIEIEDELSRINLSNCGKDKCTETVTMLTALMSCPSEKLFLEKKDLRPAAMAFRIKDWIDDNRTAEAESGFSNEDDPYEKKFPPYKAKNGPMDSLQELMLIEGWDEEMHLTFSPYLTIYPYLRGPTNTAKVNINTVKKELLACLVPSAKVECADKFFQMLIKQDKEGGARVSGANELQQFLSSDLCDSVSSEQTAKSAWFSYRTKFFRVKSQGQAGLQSRDLETVVERMIPDKAKKIETSYQFLYWKLL
jgi:type II secretory pathway component PulK